MKQLFTLVFSFLSLFIYAQQKETHQIKIYLEDAETEKNIDDAKVTLEGFEIPPIIGLYDKKNKFYYFDEIPDGYNTIMAYHKKYNEKGYQNLEGLPGELKLRLYNPLNVSYSFESYIYKNTYVEDPYKISILKEGMLDYNTQKDFINQTIKDLQLAVELVNPYWEMNKIENNPYGISQKEGYPALNLKENQKVEGGYLFPLAGGVSSFFSDRSYSNTSRDICFILRKTDGSKFKRFNDPIINKLKQQKIKICAILLNKKNGSDFTSKFKIRDKQNKKFNLKNKIDSSKVFFYDNNFRNEKKSFGLFRLFKKQHYLFFDEPNKYLQLPSFILISNEKDETYNLFREIGKENPETYRIPTPDNALGLGILDIYEYYSKAQQKT
ncbi:hypothetical protein [Flavobacterium sp. LHD-85]|uniref:hypothetical protein n=1 Tax=Flavobacterium sp. LHD-85 TaxID=3071410 RepID=UPI0027DF5009|nr:hypothetical protein [Flavobacterium sp. LHD-85]MDQ6531270.1 hypothetical protein [Flavobacterium sp. LHD-85]